MNYLRSLAFFKLLEVVEAFVWPKAEPQGFLWISQGAGLPPPWLAAIPDESDAWLVWGSFNFCDRTVDLPRFRHVCLPEVQWSLGGPVVGNTTYTPGRNLLYRHALDFEAERGQQFLYFILADDSGEFIFDRCSSSSCGNLEILPDQSDSAVSFFHSLLRKDLPAVATPLNDIDDSQCLSPLEMRVCTSSIDHKVIAFHWSVHTLLLPYEEGFEHLSLFASQCIVNEVIDAALTGYSVRYRSFVRRSLSSFPRMRPHYIRNLEPCLPKRWPNGSFTDSLVVEWLRPQLVSCASAKLGASHMLQAGCELGVKPNDRCALGARSDYSTLPCMPWAQKHTCRGKIEETVGELRRPRASGIYHVLRLSRSFGSGSSPEVNFQDEKALGHCSVFDVGCAKKVLCALGLKNFSELRASKSSHKETWNLVSEELERFLAEERTEVDQTCDVCVALLLGAYVEADFLQRNLDAYAKLGIEAIDGNFWSWWWCVVAFLHQSCIHLFRFGLVAPFDMLVFFTEQSLPAWERRQA